MRNADPDPVLRPTTLRRRCAGRIAVACVLAACSTGSATGEASRLTAALESVPGVAPRLSIRTSFRRCSEQAPPEGTITRATCPPRRSSRNPLAAVTRALPVGDGPAALHARAIVDIVLQDERGIGLDRAITSLWRLEGMVDRPAPVLADLAAALIVRAERTQAPRDLLEAYEIAEQALKHEPRNEAALYNRALALDRFGLVDETARDWQAYLAADSTSGWADDARRRHRALLAIRPPPRPGPDAPLAEYARYAAADPQGARELGMDHLLGEWGEAVEAGHTARAEDRLRRAAALGDALARRPGGDDSLADAVRAIRAAVGDTLLTHRLAGAHRHYRAGRRQFDQLQFGDAEPHFARAAEPHTGADALLGWADVYLALTRLQLGKVPEGNQLLMEVATRATQLDYSALSARARWPLGRSLAWEERWEPALQVALESVRYFATAGERENEGAALNLVADVRFVLGEPDSAYAALCLGLDRLRQHRASLRLHNLLAASSEAIASDGLRASAVRLLGESVAVATRSRHPVIEAEARLRRARLLASAGESEAAHDDLGVARALVKTMHDPRALGWITAELHQTEAVVSLDADPVRASQALDSAAAYFAAVPAPFRAFPVLVASAEARLAASDPAGAESRLRSAVRLLDQRRDSIRMEPRRAAVFDAARGLVDRLVLLKLAGGRTREALLYMDRARASLAPVDRSDRAAQLEIRTPRGETALEFAQIADTLLTWVISTDQVRLMRTVVDTIRFRRTLAELELKLERGAPDAEVQTALSLLYDWLIRPVATWLKREAPLIVVADGDVLAVPFAALYDAQRRRYLVEDHSLRFAVSLREAPRQPTRGLAGALLVADPAHDPVQHPLLERLRHARVEVQTVRPVYPGAVVLEGAAATPQAMETALRRAGVVHFAGHAVFDDDRPERSYLVLAPGAGAAQGRITAAALANFDLRHVRLVVLSACRTVRSAHRRAGGFTGLSGAFLAAGAGGTVGSTWDVDDRSTSTFMIQFHRAYAASGDGQRALRTAQLALLRSRDRTLRSPAAWAAFRYAGM